MPSPERERALADVMQAFRPTIRRLARVLARGDDDLRRALEQEGCLKLWQLGVMEIRAQSVEHTRASLRLGMRSARRRILREVVV